ncbi:MAG TPA: hypothetical protein VME47_01850 [Acetobacteraceae bacterium]|nr:hypothetical protein [Acetobacteraceae bacterium]
MPTVFSLANGVRVAITTNDHCPPHVHAVHQGEGWLVRVEFSFVHARVRVHSIEPTPGAVRQRQLNRLLQAVEGQLAACRRVWWTIRGTTCLENKWLVMQSDGMSVAEEASPNARRVKGAYYDSDADFTKIAFRVGGNVTIAGTRGEPM